MPLKTTVVDNALTKGYALARFQSYEERVLLVRKHVWPRSGLHPASRL